MATAKAKADPVAVVTDVAGILHDLEDAIRNPANRTADAIAAIGSAAGVAAELTLIDSGTNRVVAVAATVVIPAVFRLIAAVRAHGHARVQAAAITANATK